MKEGVDLGLGLPPADVEQIVTLAKRGIHVSRSAMYGGEYTSVNWSFTLDDDDEAGEPEPVSDEYMQRLINEYGNKNSVISSFGGGSQ